MKIAVWEAFLRRLLCGLEAPVPKTDYFLGLLRMLRIIRKLGLQRVELWALVYCGTEKLRILRINRK